jgi:hypothetical protein
VVARIIGAVKRVERLVSGKSRDGFHPLYGPLIGIALVVALGFWLRSRSTALKAAATERKLGVGLTKSSAGSRSSYLVDEEREAIKRSLE